MADSIFIDPDEYNIEPFEVGGGGDVYIDPDEFDQISIAEKPKENESVLRTYEPSWWDTISGNFKSGITEATLPVAKAVDWFVDDFHPSDWFLSDEDAKKAQERRAANRVTINPYTGMDEEKKTLTQKLLRDIERQEAENENVDGVQGTIGEISGGLARSIPLILGGAATKGAGFLAKGIPAAIQGIDTGLGTYIKQDENQAENPISGAVISGISDTVTSFPYASIFKGGSGWLKTLGEGFTTGGLGALGQMTAEDVGYGDAVDYTLGDYTKGFGKGSVMGGGMALGFKGAGELAQRGTKGFNGSDVNAKDRIDAAAEAMDLMAEAEGTRALPEPDERLLLEWTPEKDNQYRVQQINDLLGNEYYLTEQGDVIGAKPQSYEFETSEYKQKPIIKDGEVIGVERKYNDYPVRDFDDNGNDIETIIPGRTEREFFNQKSNVDEMSMEVPGMGSYRSYEDLTGIDDKIDLMTEGEGIYRLPVPEERLLLGWEPEKYNQYRAQQINDLLGKEYNLTEQGDVIGAKPETFNAVTDSYTQTPIVENGRVVGVERQYRDVPMRDFDEAGNEIDYMSKGETKRIYFNENQNVDDLSMDVPGMESNRSYNPADIPSESQRKAIEETIRQQKKAEEEAIFGDYIRTPEGDVVDVKPETYILETPEYSQRPIVKDGRAIGLERQYHDIPMRDFDEAGNEISTISKGETHRIFFDDMNKTRNVDEVSMDVPGMETNRSYDPQVKIERTETVPQVEGAAVPKDKTFKNVEEFKEHQAAVAKQKVEDPVITKVEPKPILEKQTDKVDVQRISREELGRRPELMQFKQTDDKVTGTSKGNRIEGQRWDDTAAGPLLVWEPINPLAYGLSGNQKYIVANGHHRLEFGDRMNVKDYNVQVLREADGWSAADVKEKAALDNINDGKGTIEDQVTFLRSYAKQVGPEEALAKAQELGFQRKDATPIALYGSDDLLNAFRRGKINQTQAAAIARTTADPALQRVGIKFAMQKKDLAAIENYLRNATHANEQMFAGDQISIFGDMGDAATNKAMALSELANDYASKLKRRINVVKPAVNNQEIAGETKVKVLKNADKEVANLIQQADKWDNWMLYPELRKQLEDEIAAGRTLEAKKKAEKQKNWMADPERGATIIFDDLIDGVAKITAKAKESLQETVSDIFALDVKDYNVPGWRRTGMDDSEKYLSGLVGKFNKVTSYPRTIAQKFPEFAATYKAGQGQIERASMNTLDFNEKFQPFLQLTPESQQVVGNLMARNRQRVLQGQKKFDETYQNWRALGLSDVEAKAALQLREGFNLAVDKIVEAKKAEEQLRVATNPNLAKMGTNYLNKKFAELDAWGADLKDKNYMPLSRRGKYYVYTDDGKYFRMFDSKKEMNADLNRLSKLGVTGRYGIEGTHVADQLSNNQLNAIGGNHGEIKGFPAHLLEAKGTSGFDTNYVRNIAEYFQLLSRYNARKLGDLDFNNAKKAINADNQKALLNYAEKYQKDLNSPNSKIIDGLQKIVVVKALSNPLTSAINLTQPLITTLPECVKYLGEGKALKVFSNAFATQKAINFNKGKGVSKELLQGLEEAKRRGLVGDNATGTMAALAKGEKPNILIDKVLLAGQNATEYINRQHAFIAGWDIAERTGIKDFNQKFDFARSFIEQTQFNTNKGNRNELTRWARLPMTFKNFGGNLFKFYMDNLKGGARGKRAAIESLAIGTLLGGYKYIPLAAALMTMANGAGYDVEKIAKDKLNKIFGSDVPAEVLFQGLGSTVGLNISGNLQSEDYADAWNLSDEHKFYESAGKVAFGASGRTLVDFARGVGAIADGDIYKGIEQMAPRLIQNPMRAYRAYEDNAFTNNKGQPIVKNPTTGELVGQALGMTPKRKNQFYEDQTKLYELINKLSDTTYMDKAAQAYLDGDMQKAGEYLLAAKEAGQKVTDKKFKNAVERRTTNPLRRQLKQLPKDIREQVASEINWVYD